MLFRRLKRRVAPGLRILAGGRRDRPDTGERLRSIAAGTNSSAPSPASTRAEVVRLAWPIAAAMLGDTAMGLVDTKLVGALGPAALGGVGVATTLMYVFYSLVLGVLRGVKVCTSHAVGN
jgi:MATE family multidrug resistance protein